MKTYLMPILISCICVALGLVPDASATEDMVFVCEGRIGSAAGRPGTAAEFELDIGATTAAPADTAHFNWQSGTAASFTISLDPTLDRKVRFSMGGQEVEYTLPSSVFAAPPLGKGTVKFNTRAYRTGSSVVLTNLTLHASGVPGLPATLPQTSLGPTGPDFGSTHQLFIVPNELLQSGFTITGQAILTWATNNPPGRSESAFQIEFFEQTIDVDIDSNNDNDLSLPTRSSAEDSVEDVSNDDNRPGKIILVNDFDSDEDGIPDYADGYGVIPDISDAVASTNSQFVPLIIEIPDWLGGSAEIEFVYDDSDPAEVTPTLTRPFVLPPGSLRVWRKDGNEPRNPASVLENGDFVNASTLTPTQAGFSSTANTLTFYVEVVRTSSETADLPITVNLYPLGSSTPSVVKTDTVRVTAEQVRITAESPLGVSWDTDGFIASGLQETGTGLNDGLSPSTVAAHTIEIASPRSGLSSMSIDGFAIPLTPSGGGYRNQTPVAFLGTADESRFVNNEPFVLTVDRGIDHVFAYNANVLPDSSSADPIQWSVNSNLPRSKLSIGGGILQVDAHSPNCYYEVSQTSSTVWQSGRDTVVSARFLIESSAGTDGALKFILGDPTNHWEIGVAPTKIVVYPNGVRTEIPFPAGLGNSGNIVDGLFHILTFNREADDGVAVVSLDGFILGTISGNGSGNAQIAWGDIGSAIRGKVQYDYVQWAHVEPYTEVIFQNTPSDTFQSYDVLVTDSASLTLSYNPSWSFGKKGFKKPDDADAVMAKEVERIIAEMEAEPWVPVNPADNGAFGKEVHGRLSQSLRHDKRWLADAYIEKDTKKVLSIGEAPAGIPSDTYNQVDAFALKQGYRPKVGDILDPNRVFIYELKASMSGKIGTDQLQALKDIVNQGEVRSVRANRIYNQAEGGFIPAQRFTRAIKVLGVLASIAGVAQSTYAMINPDTCEELFDKAVEKMQVLQNQTNPDELVLDAIEARRALIDYFACFSPVDEPYNMLKLHAIYDAMNDFP